MPISRPRLPLVDANVDPSVTRALSSLQRDLDRLTIDVSRMRDGRLYGVVNSSTAPTWGTNAVGDTVRNANPVEVTATPGENYIVWGWVCTVAGSPGTWEELRQYTGTTTAGWEDSLADISGRPTAGANAPAWTQFRDGIYAYAFSATTMNEVWVNVHVTHNWKPGTKFYPHIHWALNVAGTAGQKVHLGVEYSVAKGHNQAAFPTTTTITFEPTVSTTQYQHMITECTDNQAITVPEVDSIILMRIYRDPTQTADNVTDKVFIFFVDCHYQIDRSNGTINKAPNFYA